MAGAATPQRSATGELPGAVAYPFYVGGGATDITPLARADPHWRHDPADAHEVNEFEIWSRNYEPVQQQTLK